MSTNEVIQNHQPESPEQIAGLLARYPDVESLKKAAKQIRQNGYINHDAYTPFPVEGLDEHLGKTRNPIAPAMLIGGILGGIGGYLLQYWALVVDYPLNVGGRPLHSWPAFIPITFETTVLTSAIFGFVTLLVYCGLPKIYHPLFCVESFLSASTDSFFLWLPNNDPNFLAKRSLEHLQQTGAIEIHHVVEPEP